MTTMQEQANLELKNTLEKHVGNCLGVFPNSNLKIEIDNKSNTSLFLSVFFPDLERSAPASRAKGFILYPDESIEMSNEAASFRLYYRKINPAILMEWFGIHPKLRKEKRANPLLAALEGTAKELGCENRIFLYNVQNPSFWNYKGYRPTKFCDYWKLARRNL